MSGAGRVSAPDGWEVHDLRPVAWSHSVLTKRGEISRWELELERRTRDFDTDVRV